MELWFNEIQNENMRYSYRISKIYHKETSPFQEIAVVETEQYGKMLIIDDYVMLESKNEFIYHEMIAHVPLFTHKAPKKVAVIGGGDGGVIREIIKHPEVEKAVLIEIDKRVVEVSKEFFPSVSCGLDDKRVDVLYIDGIKYISEHKNEFDVIIVDSTDPVGPAEGLFNLQFYKNIYAALKEDGILVAQTESPFDNDKLIKRVNNDIKSVFPITKLYTASIPTYPTGMWTFTMGSKKYDPATIDKESINCENMNTKYFNKDIFTACFALPNFLREIINN